jgi:hypothetical protein
VSDETELNGMEPTEPTEAPVTAAPAPRASSGDFLSTTVGKAVLIGAAVLVLLVIAGVVGYFVLGPQSMGGGTGTPGSPAELVPSTGTPGTPSTPATSAVTTMTVADITSRDVFTPRNPFTVIKPAVIPTSGADANGNDGDTADTDILRLTDIVTVGGVRKAVFTYKGVTYTVGAGESFGGNADWTIVAVHATTVDTLMDGVSREWTPSSSGK